MYYHECASLSYLPNSNMGHSLPFSISNHPMYNLDMKVYEGDGLGPEGIEVLAVEGPEFLFENYLVGVPKMLDWHSAVGDIDAGASGSIFCLAAQTEPSLVYFF